MPRTFNFRVSCQHCGGNSEATSLLNGSSCLTGSLSTPRLSLVESIDGYSPIAFFGYCGQLRSADTMFPLLLSDQSFSATNPLFKYSFPLTIAHREGSMSAMRSSDVAYAQ